MTLGLCHDLLGRGCPAGLFFTFAGITASGQKDFSMEPANALTMSGFF